MSEWRRSPYQCPKCGGRTEGRAGKDGDTLGFRCTSCNWWKVYDRNDTSKISDELREYQI